MRTAAGTYSNRLAILGIVASICVVPALAASPPEEEVPSGWLDTVQRQIAAEEYHVTWQTRTPLADLDQAWQSPNRAQGLRTYYTEQGIRVVPRATSVDEVPAWEWSLELVGYGVGGQSWSVSPAQLSADGNRIDYLRDGLTEWYVNEPRGLKQGFTLDAPPDELAREALVHLDLALAGDLSPKISADGRSIDFVSASGALGVRYDGLVVTDATGRELASWMEGIASPARGIRIVVDATDAVWPLTVDPLATSPAWTAAGGQAGANLGISTSTAGDVNGDGYSDVIVGANLFDTGQSDAGKAYVYLGSAGGLAATAAWTAEGNQATAYFGGSVSTAGDVNGDGYADVIIGADRYDNGQIDEGLAFVYLGSAGGLTGGPNAGLVDADWTAEGNQAGAWFGNDVSTVGDVNGDGYADVIVGALHHDNGETDEGRVYVYLGSASGLGATEAWTAESDGATDRFGESVSTAGDVNGDGYADVIIGSRYYDNGQNDEGGAFVYLGSAGGLAGGPNAVLADAAWTAESDQIAAFFGKSVSTAGDVNGDGYADVIVGALFYDNGQGQEGGAFVYLGSAGGLAGGPNAVLADAAWTAESNQADAWFGDNVSTAGDVNGDGYADVIVGSRNEDNGALTDAGRAYVYLGSASGLGVTEAWTAEGGQTGALFGISVSTAGDVNGDGYSDVIVGAPRDDIGPTDEGRAFVYLGSASGPVSTEAWTAEGDQADAEFGHSVSTAGDVNGDGYSDVIVGARRYDNGETDEGRAYVYLGSASGLGATAAWTAEGDQASAQFGWSVSTAGDVNGDGYADVIVGAVSYDNGETNEGRAFVYLGSASGLGATEAWTAESDQTGAAFGGSVSTAGDVNGDGYADVIVAAYLYDNGQTTEGRAYVFLGSASGLAATAVWTAESNQAEAFFGLSVSTAGDVNGDGYADVIVGAPFYGNPEFNEGRAYVYLGSASGPVSSAAWTAEGNQAAAYFGWSVSTAGDVNGDGYADVIVGAISYDNGETDEGRAFVYLGSASGLGATAAWTAEGDQADAEFGYSVSTAGDVNGDGYADVIVGAHLYNNGETNEGRAFAYLGSASGLGATAAWTAESNQANAFFGLKVSTAGDVNGDGYADVIVGTYLYDNGQTDEGRAYVYLGNAAGVSVLPQQRRVDDSGAIVPGGWSDERDGVRLASVGRTPFGRAPVRLEWEVEPLGTLFDGAGTGVSAGATDSGLAGAALNELVGGLTPGESYHWRVRTLYDPVATPFQTAGRWFTIPRGGWNETLFSTRLEANLSVTQVDAADPVVTTDSITYTLTASNSGPDATDAAVVDTLPAAALFVSATPSQGVCVEAAGVVTCDLGTLASGGGATIEIVIEATTAGTYTNDVTISGPAADSNLLDNSASEETTVNTAQADLSLTQTDGADPVTTTQSSLSYALVVASAGPDTVLAEVVDTLPAGTSFVSATPSQGSCLESAGVVTCDLGAIAPSGGATIDVVVTASTPGVYTNQATVAVDANSDDANPANDSASEQTTVVTSALGGLVWDDRDGDGIRDGDEPGLGGILVELIDDGTGSVVNLTATGAGGGYAFTGLTSASRLRFTPPSGWVLTMPDQGGDDTLDSDANVITGETPAVGPVFEPIDATRWSAGIRQLGACIAPDEPVYIFNVRISTDGNDYTILDFGDPNQPSEVTGYNVYRSSDAGLDPALWPLLASNVVDSLETDPDNQYVDQTNDVSPSGIWYYEIAPYNAICDAEGPR